MEAMTLHIERMDLALDELNKAKVKELIPVVMYICLLTVIGLFGNVLVCVYYGFKTKQTCTTRLILAVSVIDTMICILMPKNLLDLYMTYKFTSSTLCQLMYFVNHVMPMSSVFVLSCIAIFRHRAVCRPFESQFKLKHSNIVIVASTIVALVLSVPVLFLYEAVPIAIKESHNLTIIGHDCTASNKAHLKLPLMIVTGVHFCVFIGTSTTLFVLYGLTAKVIYRHVKRWNHTSRVKVSTNTSSSLTTNRLVEVVDDEHKVADVRQKHLDVSQTFSSYSEKETSTSWTRKCKQLLYTDRGISRSESMVTISQKNTRTVKTPKHTLMLFIVAIVFVVSFVPYLAVTVRNSLSADDDEMTVGIQLAVRSYLLNSAVNPLVYGLCNSKFRQFVYGVCVKKWLHMLGC